MTSTIKSWTEINGMFGSAEAQFWLGQAGVGSEAEMVTRTPDDSTAEPAGRG